MEKTITSTRANIKSKMSAPRIVGGLSRKVMKFPRLYPCFNSVEIKRLYSDIQVARALVYAEHGDPSKVVQ